ALGDHMVLQRRKPAPIWGAAEAGEKVTVRFAGQSKTAVAGKDGRWLVRLDALEASAEPRELAIEAASGAATIRDVLVGDVWIAGGQSNMGRDVRRSWTPPDQRLDYPHIRFLTVRSRGSKYPQTELLPPPPPSSPPRDPRATESNRWHVCTDQTTPECCAVGFFFAERIYKETGIPQGLLWNAWAGSVAKEWVPRFGWRLRPELEDTARQVDAWYPGTETGRAAFTRAVDEIAAWCGKAAEAVRQGDPFPYPQPLLPEPDDAQGSGRGTTILYNGRVHPLVPYAVAGILWYQGESDYANARYLPEIEAMAESWRTLFACPGEKPADLPFYFVQMQRCGSYMSPGVRDFQLQSYFTIPNAGMAVLLDLDMNLHPANKYDSGRRLALWALAKDYGKDVVFSGPIYRRHRAEGDKVVVEFEFTQGGLFIGTKDKLDPPKPTPGGKLVNLEITADGREWQPAQSRIDGDRLIAWADGLRAPTDVRYCWKSKADEPFLYGRAGLPAAQFNTTSPYAIRGRTPAGSVRAGGAKPSPSGRRGDKPARREVQLPGVLGDQCVLQRDAAAAVWGRAEPGEKVAVTFAGQAKHAAADRFGRWRVELDPMPASAEGRPLKVEGPTNTVEVKDVRVGDVWLYLSQSWHLDTQKAPPLFDEALPPISAHAAAGVWEFRNHSQRRQAGYDDGARWSLFKPPGRYFRNDGFYLGAGLARATQVPVGVMGLGASTLESMTPPEGFQAFERELGELGAAVTTWTPDTRRGKQAYLAGIQAIEQWVARSRATLGGEDITFRDLTQPPPLPGPPRYERAPTTAYNFAIHRYTPAAFRGIIVQPKDFNVGDPMYLLKAKALIRGLREACGRADLPVCFVQMHSPDRNEQRNTADPNDWVRMRDAQGQLATLPNTTVLATYDLKSTGRSESDLGLRAAQWAAAVVANAPVRTGPTYRKHRVDGRSVVVEFDHVGKGLTAGAAPAGRPVEPAGGGRVGGFQLAGSDGSWHDAAAAIQGETVVVSCEKVSSPAGVRYAWRPAPAGANLYNRDGFCALPFSRP
ncbi:MAG TPA: hypothetical protein VM695_05165, partial [Phycisphaerae bacterium]|nr:hypothetical protein [Phycisphaerae bacterium]